VFHFGSLCQRDDAASSSPRLRPAFVACWLSLPKGRLGVKGVEETHVSSNQARSAELDMGLGLDKGGAHP